jgi:hypothetical protein
MLRRGDGFYVVVPNGVHFPMKDRKRGGEVSCFLTLAGVARLSHVDHLTHEIVREIFRNHRPVFEALASSLHSARVGPRPN